MTSFLFLQSLSSFSLLSPHELQHFSNVHPSPLVKVHIVVIPTGYKLYRIELLMQKQYQIVFYAIIPTPRSSCRGSNNPKLFVLFKAIRVVIATHPRLLPSNHDLFPHLTSLPSQAKSFDFTIVQAKPALPTTTEYCSFLEPLSASLATS